MREEIGRRFVERSFSWGPYLYPDPDDDTSEGTPWADSRRPSDDGLRYGEARLLRRTSHFTCKSRGNKESMSRLDPLTCSSYE